MGLVGGLVSAAASIGKFSNGRNNVITVGAVAGALGLIIQAGLANQVIVEWKDYTGATTMTHKANGVLSTTNLSGSLLLRGGSLTASGAFVVKRTATAGNISSVNEVIIGVTNTDSPRTVTLDTDDVVHGRIVIIKDESGGANLNNITIETEGAETIDGAATATIDVAYGYVNVFSDGSNWFIWGQK